MAEKKSPPITVMAKGAPIAPAYSVSPIANGSMAAIVVMEVIRMGRIQQRMLWCNEQYKDLYRTTRYLRMPSYPKLSMT